MKSTITTLGDIRDEKAIADSVAAYREATRARLAAESKFVVDQLLAKYPQIGVLSSGKFYTCHGGPNKDQYVESYFPGRVLDAIGA
jgi:hypothetical protein